MPWVRETTRLAGNDLAGIPIGRERAAVIAAIDKLIDDPGGADIAKLYEGTWHLREGHWRVIFETDTDAGIIRILRAVRRNEDTYGG
jgi:mRNA-degrading endonuclease RelE of RelBE toxin-antitoxin system